MSWTVDGYNITMTRGDTFQARFPFILDGEEYTLKEGDSARFAVRAEDGSSVVIEKVLDNYVLTLSHNDTKDLAFGMYRYDCEVYIAETDQTYTYIPEVPKGKAKFTLTWEAK